MIKQELSGLVDQSLLKVKRTGQLFFENMPCVIIERTKDKTFGDFSTSLPLNLAQVLKKNPVEIAGIIKNNLKIDKNIIEKVEIAGPGYLNFFISRTYLYNLLSRIVSRKEKFSNCKIGRNKRVQVEFASVGPTGPAHIGHARGAVLGDVLANIFRELGFKVKKEYYVNDFGNQIDILGRSLKVRCKEVLDPSLVTEEDRKIIENGYEGNYLLGIAKKLVKECGSKCLSENVSFFSSFAVKENLSSIKKDLEDFGVNFDSWTKETDLYKKKKVDHAIKALKKSGNTAVHDGALWFSLAEQNQEDKDNVLIRQNGMPTYFASDIAYHADKFEKKFDIMIDIWGQDHHGHVQRVKNALKVLGYDPCRLEVILYQLVNLTRNSQPIKMSTRKGEFVTLREVMDEVGKDSIRFFFLMRKASSHLNFDLELAKSQSMENPVYYVQYAHARICSIFSEAEKQLKRKDFRASKEDIAFLKEDAEMELLKKLAYFQDVLFEIVCSKEPQSLTVYLQDLASLFHKFYCECKVINENPHLTSARLLLVRSVQIAISKGLMLLGVDPKERM